ncbi:RluA family pseudouridine synthase [Rubripirellula amarantea]|uniref:Pseudouridine synthase n=1 Tax=Rubripirellula amarantea TaxID=2527999 RepID=A0A5C5WQ62_9BACT|nr:RluA family pseudouridine synthase [Rubripirellula amarantea]MDA8745320.1 RluA family pseudouridine synthase [Rubripirellula amarantea]TWT52570.1 Ribosomal large subunit pseudouridine synthase D [Rubripirellula amarantea]
MAITTRTITIDAPRVGRLDLVVRELAETSRSQVKGMVDQGCVSVNGKPCRSIGQSVSEGDVVSLTYDDARRYKENKKSWEDRTFSIVFEDEHLIVVEKAASVLTVPTDYNDRNTLVERVSLYLSHSRRKREAFLVHRLDRAVSGLLVFGKQEEVADALIEQFKQRKPKRLYSAIVAGVMPDDQGTFDSHLATGNNLDQYSTRPSKDTERAITHYRVLKRLSDATHVELTLETGKRNQIRVHLSEAGHPVLGDQRYEPKKATHDGWVKKRIALHAKSLEFVHPVTGETLSFESPLPTPMQKFMAGAR